jgi:hypothetical protein
MTDNPIMTKVDRVSAPDEALKTWLQRIRCEYIEDPGLRLTCRQATRFFGLEQRTCQAILAALVAEGFLRSTAGEAFARALFL